MSNHPVCNNCKFWTENEKNYKIKNYKYNDTGVCSYLAQFLTLYGYEPEGEIDTPKDFFCTGYQRKKEE
jgi:hypothetical protein